MRARRRGEHDQVTVITGAAHGIARRFATDLLAVGGHKVIACDVDETGLRHALGGTRAQLIAFDVRQFDAWQRLADRVVADHGRWDVLCNIAGVLTPVWLPDAHPATIDAHIDVNVKGVIYGSRVASAVMVRQRRGHIVNMASQAGIGFTPGNTLYGASKHAVRGFSVSLAAELRRLGVAVTCVCPGIVDTRMLAAQLDRREGATSFLTGRPLTVSEVSAELQRVLRARPVESAIPRATLARLANLRPSVAVRFADLLVARGVRAAARVRRERCGDPRGATADGDRGVRLSDQRSAATHAVTPQREDRP